MARDWEDEDDPLPEGSLPPVTGPLTEEELQNFKDPEIVELGRNKALRLLYRGLEMAEVTMVSSNYAARVAAARFVLDSTCKGPFAIPEHKLDDVEQKRLEEMAGQTIAELLGIADETEKDE